MSKHTVFIDGAVGTTGLRIYERLAEQPDIEVIALPDEERKDTSKRIQAACAASLTMLCLPDEAAKELVRQLPAGTKVCDASTAHRTQKGWIYGFAELGKRRNQIADAARIAVPGCHATGYLSLITPLVQKGALPTNVQLSCTSLTGYSGGGKAMIAAYENTSRHLGYTSPRQYGLSLSHKHLPEMKHISGLDTPPHFSPIVADYYSGMLVSVPIATSALAKPYASKQAVAALLQEYYASEPLITVHEADAVPEDFFLAANAMSGYDNLEIFITGSKDSVLLAARFDNLGKGASGAAVQCINLMLGRPESAGLHIKQL